MLHALLPLPSQPATPAQEYAFNHTLKPRSVPLDAFTIFFTNFFVTRVDWWAKPEVRAFLSAVDETGQIYESRWGDAPIQTAALKIFCEPEALIHMPIDYLHVSTFNMIQGGKLNNQFNNRKAAQSPMYSKYVNRRRARSAPASHISAAHTR